MRFDIIYSKDIKIYSKDIKISKFFKEKLTVGWRQSEYNSFLKIWLEFRADNVLWNKKIYITRESNSGDENILWEFSLYQMVIHTN